MSNVPEVFQLKLAVDGCCLTRGQGEQVREQIVMLERQVDPAQRVIIDFSGVIVMTPSFADECFGKLAERLGDANFRERITLRNANQTVRTLVNGVLRGRLSRAAS